MTGTFRILLPLEQTNFKGRVELEVFDSSGRNAKVQKHYGIESGEKHREAGTAALTILTEPGRVVDGHPWYNGDVEIRADFQDSYTGLGSYAITADGERKKARNYREEADGQSGPVREASETLRLEATQYNRNDIQVTASYTDNAGHTGEARRTLSIDMTKPEIRVTYDRNQPEGDGLYREPRTATVTVKERNFDPGTWNFSSPTRRAACRRSVAGATAEAGRKACTAVRWLFRRTEPIPSGGGYGSGGQSGGVRRNGYLYHRSDAAGASGILGGAGGQERQLLPGGAQGADSGAGAELRSGTCPN